MREEPVRALIDVNLAKWQPDVASEVATFDHNASMCLTPAISPPYLRCTDSDDQVFIDLALAEGARWLLTHDRALLKLARRAAVLGVLVQKPRAWRHLHEL
jgi:predicted nucleic acid-binding protein